MDETIKGLIADQGRTYGYDDPVRSRDLNRWQKDLARLSWAQQKMGADLHYPHVATFDNKFQATASADKVSLDTGVKFILAGVPFDTADLDSTDLEFDIPDNSTRFLRVGLASDCGTAVLDDPADSTNKNWVVTRELKLSFSLVSGTEEDAEGTGGGPSSPESMRILKAVKAEAGTSPTITLYENSGHGHVVPNLTAENVSFDNTDADLPSDPANVQAAIEAAILSGYTNVVPLTSSGTFVQGTTVPANVFNILIIAQGAGAGGCAAGSDTRPGGGAGATLLKWYTLSSGQSITYTIGAAGTGGTSNGVGNDGGSTIFGTICTAPGGSATTQSARGHRGGAGGVSTDGDINIPGEDGQSTSYDRGGRGGNSMLGRGGQPGAYVGATSPTDGDDATGYGAAGGGAAYNATLGAGDGGDGTPGVILILYKS